MMLEFPLRLHPCRLCHGNSEILDRRSFRSDAILFFIYFFPTQTLPQRLAKLLLLGLVKKKEKERKPEFDSRIGHHVKKGKRGAYRQKAATVIPNRTAAILCIFSSLSSFEFDIVRYGGTS